MYGPLHGIEELRRCLLTTTLASLMYTYLLVKLKIYKTSARLIYYDCFPRPTDACVDGDWWNVADAVEGIL